MLRIADGDERPTLAEVASTIDYVKVQIKKILKVKKMQLEIK